MIAAPAPTRPPWVPNGFEGHPSMAGQALVCARLQQRFSNLVCSRTGGAKAPRKLKLNVAQFSYARASLVGRVPRPEAGRPRPTFAFALPCY